jgi:hypothetical protein
VFPMNQRHSLQKTFCALSILWPRKCF